MAHALVDAFDNDFHALGEHAKHARMNARPRAKLGFRRDDRGHDGQHQKAQMARTIAGIARRIDMSLLVRGTRRET